MEQSVKQSQSQSNSQPRDVCINTEENNTSSSAKEQLLVPSTSQDQQNIAWNEVKKLVEEDIEKKSKNSSHQLVMSNLSNSEINRING